MWKQKLFLITIYDTSFGSRLLQINEQFIKKIEKMYI